VVEAIIESLKVKSDLFKFLDDKAKYVFLYTPARGLAADHQAGLHLRYQHLQFICYRDCGFLLGCSTRKVRVMTDVADDRFAGLHFFNRKLSLAFVSEFELIA
jgi:hypothetical protein